MTATTTTSVVAQLEAVVLGPVNAFLTALQQPGVNYQTAIQDFLTLQAGEVAILPTLEADAIGDAAAALQAKLPVPAAA